ncbi:acetylornithine/succinylornithine family transaminase [Flagellatimonas centrodinii]|uniref:acetylornithine/succinylornithine family transaminase n=1 Tax=Flagellatimonas centrodinii TaxID=2806210 RepID=UPI001FEFD6A5|nr:acetylornithine/succinylornithine family transaminase [Flagellatimonas centrodinii]ULQ47003.1 acetylornithine/succinylornithine family transaminase [Flagellatimonas centrodinii]
MSVTRQTFDQHMVPNYQPAEIIPVRGQGSRWWDQAGREYVDLAGGIAVTSLGHAHPALVDALTHQAQQLWHLSNVMTNEPALRLARLLTTHTFADRVFFCNSGAEANEAALKLARRYGNLRAPGKHRIIACVNSFHGRTLFTVTVGGQPKYTHGFEPLPPQIDHVPYNDLPALEAAMGPDVCAFIVEPIQGEGGVMPAAPGYLEAAAALCRQHQALLIFDEVQTGNGRTGGLYAYQQAGVVPDVLTTAKGMGGGFPIGAMLTTEALAATLSVGTHGSTYGGNPLGCAVAEAVLTEVLSEALMQNVADRHQQLVAGLEALGSRFGLWTGVRGQGLLLGAPLVAAWQGKAGQLAAAALRHGVWVLVAGPDVLRFAPALNITAADVDEGLQRLGTACAAVLGDTA